MLWLQIECHVLGDSMMALMLLAIKCRNRMNERLLACNFTASTLFKIWMLIATLLEATLLHHCQQVSAEIKDWEIPIDYNNTALQNQCTSQFLGCWRVSGSSLITECKTCKMRPYILNYMLDLKFFRFVIMVIDKYNCHARHTLKRFKFYYVSVRK